ncbi:MAG: hypothetical protein JNM98_06240 [Rhodocyclaceae bacterium]|nr:hypothetical protein [Rhodocyclaceae bacterium]
MTTIHDIEALARNYARARDALREVVSALEVDIEASKRKAMGAIRARIGKSADAHNALRDCVGANPALFCKPRSIIAHGIKMGWQVSPASVEIDDLARTVELIRKHRPQEFDELIGVKYTPKKSALQQLSAADLRKLGCSISGQDDRPFVRPVDSELDKLVDALIKDATREDAHAAG